MEITITISGDMVENVWNEFCKKYGIDKVEGFGRTDPKDVVLEISLADYLEWFE